MDAAQPSETSPAERRRRKVREAILSAAERVFAEDGEAGLSIRRLADEIDYSPAAIYKYFGSKTELVDELKEAFFERLLGKIDEMGASTRPFPERARDCVATYIRTALEKPHHYAAAFSSIPSEQDEDGGALSPAAFGESNKGLAFAYLAQLMEEGVAAGHFRRGLNAREAAKSVWASCHGLALMMAHLRRFPAMLADEEVDRDGFIDFHADNLIRGLEA